MSNARGGKDFLCFFQAETKGVQDKRHRKNHAGLKAAARSIIAVKLHIEREQNDRPEEKTLVVTFQDRGDPLRVAPRPDQSRSETSRPPREPSRMPRSKNDRKARRENRPARLAQRIKTAIARQHRRDDIRHSDVVRRFLHICLADIGVRRRVWIAKRRHVDRRVYASAAPVNKVTAIQRHRHAAALRTGFSRRDVNSMPASIKTVEIAGPDRGFGKGHVNGVQRDEKRRRQQASKSLTT